MPRSARKIFVNAGYAPSLVNFRLPLLQALQRAGLQVATAAGSPDDATTDRLRAAGISFTPMPLARAGLNPLQDRAYQRALRDCFLQEKPDIVLSYTHKASIFGALAAREAGVPAIYSLVTGLGYAFAPGTEWKRHLSRWILQRWYRKVLPFHRGVIFQNEDDRDLFQRRDLLGTTPATIVPGSGVDVTHFAQTPLPSAEPVSFLCIARLISDKGLRELAEASRLLRKQGRRFTITVVGPFDENPNAISLSEVEQWEQEGLLRYGGTTRDVRPALHDCHVYVLPSSYREGVPRTILEALAVGRPIITTDAPGCRTTVPAAEPLADGLLAGANGFLVPVRDAPALARAMGWFLDHPTELHSMADASRRLAENHFEASLVAEQMLRAMELVPQPDEALV